MPIFKTLDVSTPTDREILFRRDFTAPPQLLFDCHTVPALVRRWLLGPPGWTMPVCEIELRVGGSFRYVWRNEEGTEMGMGGTFREIAPPHRLVTTELFDEDWTGGETVVNSRFDPEGSGTRMTMSVLYATRAARDGALQTDMTDGMESGYARLDALIAESPAA